MEQTIIQAFYWILPAYFANMSPVIFAKLGLLKPLARPMDRGRTMGGKELFGKNKTWRGLAAGIIGATIISGLQAVMYDVPWFKEISLLNYQSEWLVFGILMGAGAIIGDLIKSFFKRRLGIASGGVWPVFDQLDFIAGSFAFAYFISWPGWHIFVAAMLMTLLLHPLTNLVGYLLGFKKVWW